LKIYLRILAVLYLLGALLHFADMLDLRLEFSSMNAVWKAWVIYLAAFDLAASIGLWQQRRWGVYLFFMVAVSQIIAYVGFPSMFGGQQLLIAFHLIAVSLFGVLAWHSKRSKRFRYTIDMRGSQNTILVNALDGNKLIGHFLCHKGPYCPRCYPTNLHCDCNDKKEKIWIMRSGPQVLSKYKGKGIGSAMYRLAEKHFRLRVMPDGKASEEGRNFRQSYERKYGPWGNDFAEDIGDPNLPTPEFVPFKKDSFIV
jgi:hypothetical protein